MLIGLTQQGTRFRCLSQLILAVPAIESGIPTIALEMYEFLEHKLRIASLAALTFPLCIINAARPSVGFLLKEI